jgi:DNA-binding HxlR family transcriptional regulator
MAEVGSYGQYCPVAMASEILCSRWTILVVREMLCGTTRFNDLRRGVPRMSPSLLSKRLKELEGAGVVRAVRSAAGATEYRLTEAGEELRPIVLGMGFWGQRWVESQLTLGNLDPALLMWDMRRNLRRDVVPTDRRAVIEFVFAGVPSPKRTWWLVFDEGDVDLCLKRPGFDIDLRVNTDVKTLTDIWMGQVKLKDALDSEALTLEGAREVCSLFRACFDPHPLARMPEWPWPTLSPTQLANTGTGEAREPQ